MKRTLLALATLLVYVLHQDVWFWRAPGRFVFGFLPIGLFYHACYSVLARSLLMWLLVAYAWPDAPRARGGAAARGSPAVIPTADRLRLPGGRRLHRRLRLPPGARQGGGRGLLPRQPLARPVRVPDVAVRHEHDGLRDPRARPATPSHNGIVTFGLMASSSALVIPLSLFLIGTRVWALGKRYGFITPVQLFRDRWETSHIGTVIFAVQAALLRALHHHRRDGRRHDARGRERRAACRTGWAAPSSALVVMSYVFFGGMRGTAWVNTFQTTLFLALRRDRGGRDRLGHGRLPRPRPRRSLASPQSHLLTRERVSPLPTSSATRSSRSPRSPSRTSRSSASPRGAWPSSSRP